MATLEEIRQASVQASREIAERRINNPQLPNPLPVGSPTSVKELVGVIERGGQGASVKQLVETIERTSRGGGSLSSSSIPASLSADSNSSLSSTPAPSMQSNVREKINKVKNIFSPRNQSDNSTTSQRLQEFLEREKLLDNQFRKPSNKYLNQSQTTPSNDSSYELRNRITLPSESPNTSVKKGLFRFNTYDENGSLINSVPYRSVPSLIGGTMGKVGEAVAGDYINKLANVVSVNPSQEIPQRRTIIGSMGSLNTNSEALEMDSSLLSFPVTPRRETNPFGFLKTPVSASEVGAFALFGPLISMGAIRKGRFKDASLQFAERDSESEIASQLDEILNSNFVARGEKQELAARLLQRLRDLESVGDVERANALKKFIDLSVPKDLLPQEFVIKTPKPRPLIEQEGERIIETLSTAPRMTLAGFTGVVPTDTNLLFAQGLSLPKKRYNILTGGYEVVATPENIPRTLAGSSQLEQKPLSISQSFQETLIGSRFKQQNRIKSLLASRSQQLLRQNQQLKVQQRLRQQEELRTSQRTIQGLMSVLGLRSQTQQRTKQGLRQKTGQESQFRRVPPIKLMRRTSIPSDFSRKNISEGLNYILQVRRNKKFSTLAKGSNVKSLFNKGASYTDRTLASSFRILNWAGKPIQYHKTPSGFYKSKREKGVFIEQRNRRLDTASEVRDILGLKKQKGRKKFRI